ncbi:MAG: PEP-CTERM sorting domain-containing protein, partial [Akkermansiaceae bacterium]|nr:PEP-CTERM sorting domain-containing protein [Akkermansiaceae bacterium]
MKTILFLLALAPSLLQAGSFPGAAGSPGSDAISKDSSSFVAWANGNLSPDYGSGVDAVWRTPEKAYGPATDNAFDIVCMGNGGRITMYFPLPIRDGVGADFAVFENAIAPGFLEMAFVEVSSDGVNFFRFSNRSQGTTPFGSLSHYDGSHYLQWSGWEICERL